MTPCEICGVLAYWLIFFGVLGGGSAAIYITVSNTGLYQPPAIVGFTVCYIVAAVIAMCVLTALGARIFCRKQDQDQDHECTHTHDHTIIN